MPALNRNNSNWSFEERRKINENWDILERQSNSSSNLNNELKEEVENLKSNFTETEIRSRNALQTANQASSQAGSISGVANEANATANNALQTANNALTASNSATSTSQEAIINANSVRDQFDQIIAEAGSNNPEVVASRVDSLTGDSYSSLPERLDSQLNQTTNRIRNISYDITDFGAVANNSSRDSTEIIQNLYNSLNAGETLLIPKGTFYVTNLIFDKNEVHIETDGIISQFESATGSAIRFGRPDGNTNRVRAKVNVSKQNGRNWNQENVGIEMLNSNEFEIEIIALNFTRNVLLRGNNFGTAYNTIKLTRIVNGRYNVYLDVIGTGFVNENKFFGGRLAWFSDVSESNKWHIYIPSSSMNNNVFVSISSEARGSATLIYCNGNNNTFISPRLESDSGIVALHFGPNSIYNQVLYPYLNRDITNNAVLLDEGTRNHVYDRDLVTLNRTQLRVDNLRIRGSLNSSNAWDTQAMLDIGSRVTNNDNLFVGRNVAGTATSKISSLGDISGRGLAIVDPTLNQDIFKISRSGNQGIFTGNARANQSIANNGFVPFSITNAGIRPSAVTEPGTSVFNSTTGTLYVSMGGGQYVAFKPSEEE